MVQVVFSGYVTQIRMHLLILFGLAYNRTDQFYSARWYLSHYATDIRGVTEEQDCEGSL